MKKINIKKSILMLMIAMILGLLQSQNHILKAETKPVEKENIVIVKNFEELLNVLNNDNQDEDQINIMVEQDIELREPLVVTNHIKISTDTDAKLIRGEDNDETLLTINEGANLTLDGSITLDGAGRYIMNNSKYDGASAIEVYGVLNIEDAQIINHESKNSPAIVGKEDAQITFNSGSINNNSVKEGYLLANAGGGIKLLNDSKLVMNGGAVENNQSNLFGAGVSVIDNSTFILNDGLIKGNKTNHPQSIGGGIYVELSANFIMNNGQISENIAGNGAGIAIGSSNDEADKHIGEHTIIAGLITQNKATEMFGGGIYIPTPYASLKLNDVIVYNNTARLGGGLYDCPTGSSHTYVTHGGAVVNNTAIEGGNMLFRNIPDPAYDPKFSISNRILGGSKQNLYLDSKGDRYQEGDDAIQVEKFEDTKDYLYLHNIVEEGAYDIAYNRAKLIITENEALPGAGGGIANNGSLIIGNKDESKELTVSKKWDTSQTIPDKILVNIVTLDEENKETIIEEIELSKDNNWELTLNELPGEFNYKAVELETYEFDVEYHVHEEDNHIYIEIVNKDKIEKIDNGVVVVHYVDENQNELTPSIKLTGEIGTDYSTDQKEFSNYIFKEISADSAPQKGVFGETVQHVTYVYRSVATSPIEPDRPEPDRPEILNPADPKQEVKDEVANPPQTGIMDQYSVHHALLLVSLLTLNMKRIQSKKR